MWPGVGEGGHPEHPELGMQTPSGESAHWVVAGAGLGGEEAGGGAGVADGKGPGRRRRGRALRVPPPPCTAWWASVCPLLQGRAPAPPGLGSASTEQALGRHSCYRVLIRGALAFWACRWQNRIEGKAWLDGRLS